MTFLTTHFLTTFYSLTFWFWFLMSKIICRRRFTAIAAVLVESCFQRSDMFFQLTYSRSLLFYDFFIFSDKTFFYVFFFLWASFINCQNIFTFNIEICHQITLLT